MKGGLYVPRGMKLTFILFTLFGMTLLFWGWEKAPLLGALIQPYGPFLPASPGVLVDSFTTSVTSEIPIHVDNNPPMIERNEMSDESTENSVAIGVQVNSTADVENASSQKKLMHEDDDQPSTQGNNTVEKNAEKPVDMEMQIVSAAETLDQNDQGTSPSSKDEKISQLTEERVPAAAVPTSAPNASSMVGMKDGGNVAKVHPQTCNYAKGKWVADDRRPFYSGFGCKKWLSGMWACRLTNRNEFSFEKFRWQPKDCEMEEFEGSKFLERMQDKTLAFVGDSLGRQQFQSLMCMITGGKERRDVLNVGWEYGLVKARGRVRPDGWAYRFPSTNTTILYYWSACLCDLEPLDPSNPSTEYAMHLDRPPSFFRRFLPSFDIVVLNTGHHWNRGKINGNRWVMHVGGVRNSNRELADIGGAKNFTIHSLVQWLDSQLPLHPRMNAFYRSISPRHFFNGDWNTGGTCDSNNPLSKGREVVQDESMDSVSASAVKGTKVKLLDITALSQLRDEGHISRYGIRSTAVMQDCLHWCLPGIPDTWNEILFAVL